MFRSKIPRMFNCKKRFLKKGAERDSLKKWIPIMEMQYRGAVYRDWCQGGLPEGKVHLILEDGRMYDGMWCYGKRSGPGTFYFNHGDVFQGSWRDDVIHGKNLATANSVIWWYSSISPPVACSLEDLVTWFRVNSAGISREIP
eukprot:XP_024462791.1 protein ACCUMULATION AND REPLICATION OF CHLOROPLASTS 3 [Populus trichocarpa]